MGRGLACVALDLANGAAALADQQRGVVEVENEAVHGVPAPCLLHAGIAGRARRAVGRLGAPAAQLSPLGICETAWLA
jgi:hypothetical protein